MNFTLYLVKDGDACGSTVHSEGPPNLLRKFSSKVPSASSNLGLVNLNGAWQLNKRQNARMHVMRASLAKKQKLRLKGIATAAHIAGHFWCGPSNPHGKREVEQQRIERIQGRRLGHSLCIEADGANPDVTYVVAASAHQSHP